MDVEESLFLLVCKQTYTGTTTVSFLFDRSSSSGPGGKARDMDVGEERAMESKRASVHTYTATQNTRRPKGY